jgi:hypothetical protein
MVLDMRSMASRELFVAPRAGAWIETCINSYNSAKKALRKER